VLPAVAAWRERDPLTARVLEQILLGVSTRGYADSLEAWPAADLRRSCRDLSSVVAGANGG